MKKFIVILITVALTATGVYLVLRRPYDEGNKVIAVVNGQEIKYRQITFPEWFLESYVRGLGEEEAKRKIMQLQKEHLRWMIEGILIQKEIERRGITASEEEIRAVAREWAEMAYHSEEARKLHKEMTGEELTLEGLEEQYMKAPDIKWGIKENKLFKSILKDVTVSEEEIKNYYYSLPLRENKKVRVEYFWHQDKSIIEAVQRELKAGVGGEQLVKKYKLYPDHGGANMISGLARNMFLTEEDLKVLEMDEGEWIVQEQDIHLSEEDLKVLEMDEGEVSEITKVKKLGEDHFQVIHLLEIIEVEERRPLAEMREKIRKKLHEEKKNDAKKDFLEKLWKEANIKFYASEYSLDNLLR